MDKRTQEAARRGLDELEGGASEHRALANFFRALAAPGAVVPEPSPASPSPEPAPRKDGGRR